MYRAPAVRCGLPRGRWSRAALMHCLACATLNVKCREASSHERHASRQVKWIKHTNDRSTLLCNIRPLHRRRIHNDGTNECWCVLASCQSKQNWRAHSGTFSHERKSIIPPCLYTPVRGHNPGENTMMISIFS